MFTPLKSIAKSVANAVTGASPSSSAGAPPTPTPAVFTFSPAAEKAVKEVKTTIAERNAMSVTAIARENDKRAKELAAFRDAARRDAAQNATAQAIFELLESADRDDVIELIPFLDSVKKYLERKKSAKYAYANDLAVVAKVEKVRRKDHDDEEALIKLLTTDVESTPKKSAKKGANKAEHFLVANGYPATPATEVWDRGYDAPRSPLRDLTNSTPSNPRKRRLVVDSDDE